MGQGAAEGIKGILVERDEGRGLLTCGYYQTARVANVNCPCADFDFLGVTADRAGGTGATALKGGRGFKRSDSQTEW